jgi:SAM-dependent methyltransferase
LLPALDGTWVGVDVAAGYGPSVLAEAVVAADVLNLPFMPGTFDGVLSTSTLDHFVVRGDLRRSLLELRRVVRDGGLLVLTMDNRTNVAIRIRNAMPRLAHTLTGQVPFPVGETVSERDGKALLASCGFEVTEVEHLLHAPFVIGTRLARWKWWERHALPAFDRLHRYPIGRSTGHFVAFRAFAGQVSRGALSLP